MGRGITRRAVVATLIACVLGSAASVALAQEALTARLDPSGAVRLLHGPTELAMVELNAHGPEWTHAPQATATVQTSALTNPPGCRFTGVLPIPKTTGALRFTETATLAPEGLRLEWDLAPTATLKLNGLQVSVNLPVSVYAGKEVQLSALGIEPQGVILPAEPKDQTVGLWSGSGARVEVAKGSPEAFKVELRAQTDVVVQDLRRWEHDVFEIRFPALTEDGGLEVTTEDRFHLDLLITAAAPLKLVGP